MIKIGIIGGMGALATADLFYKLINETNAKKDSDNFPIIIENNTQIPDRTKAILDKNAENPVPHILKSANILKSGGGAEVLLMACNTAHYFYDEISKAIDIPLLNMIEITSNYIKDNKINKICVLSTKGTKKVQIYDKYLKKNGIEVVYPNEEQMNVLDYYIYDVVKANNYPKKIDDFLELLDEIKRKEGIDCFLLGCTELPIIFEKYGLEYNTIDPAVVLSKYIVEKYKK